MSRVEIRGEQHSVGEIFSERYAFMVPPYQRQYAWKQEHAGELLDDLLLALGDGDVPLEELDPYFLGSIVLIERGRQEYEIVDGQQRLITLTILPTRWGSGGTAPYGYAAEVCPFYKQVSREERSAAWTAAATVSGLSWIRVLGAKCRDRRKVANMTWATSMPIVSGIVLALIVIVAIVLTLPRVLLGGPVQRLRGLIAIVVLVVTMVAVFSTYITLQRVQQEIGSPQSPGVGPNLSGPGSYFPTSPTIPSFATPTTVHAIGAP